MPVFKNKPPVGASMREQFRHALLEVVTDECYILGRAGAKEEDLKLLISEAEDTASVGVFNKIAAYAEKIMPELEANRANWPVGFRHTNLVQETPVMLRRMAKTFPLNFARDSYIEKPPTERQKKLEQSLANNRRLLAKRPPSPPVQGPPAPPPRNPWELRNVPEAQQTALERLAVFEYAHWPEKFQRSNPNLYHPLRLACMLDHAPRDWDAYYRGSSRQRADIIIGRLKDAVTDATQDERRDIAAGMTHLWLYKKSLREPRSPKPAQ